MRSPEQQRPGNGQTDHRNLDQRDTAFRLLLGLAGNILQPTDHYTEPLVEGNATLLLSGDHGGIVMDKPSGRLAGAAGATITRPSRFGANADLCIVSDLRFEDTVTADADAQVSFLGCTFTGAITIPAGATGLRFRSCRFEGAVTVQGSGAVAVFDGCTIVQAATVASGGTGIFNGCTLFEAVTVADGGMGHWLAGLFAAPNGHVNYPVGPFGRCFVATGSRKSGVAHVGNVNILAETT